MPATQDHTAKPLTCDCESCALRASDAELADALATITVVVFTNRYAKSYPRHPHNEFSRYLPIANALATHHESDAHFAPYIAPDRMGRLAKSGPTGIGAHRLLERGIHMVACVFDIDNEEAHETGEPASEEWRGEIRGKVDKLFAVHPGGYLFHTRGGCRLIYRAQFHIASADDDLAWTRQYLRACCYLAREFGVVADPACADWPRLFRLPHVVRDGKQQPEWGLPLGEPSRLAMLSPLGDNLEADIRTARELGWTAVAKKLGHAATKDGKEDVSDDALPPMGIRRQRGSAYLAKCPAAISGERGHEQTWNVVLHVVRGFALPVEIAIELISEEYNPRCSPPWSESELRHKVEDAYASNTIPWGEKLEIDHAPRFARMSHVVLANQLVCDLSTVVGPVFAEGELWSYAEDAGIYVERTESEQLRLLAKYDGVLYGSRDGDKTKYLALSSQFASGAMRFAQAAVAEPEFFADGIPGLSFSNGFVSISKDGVTLEAHAPDHRARHSYDFAYDETRSALFESFLAAIFKPDDDSRQKMQFLQEFLGLGLFGMATLFQIAAILLGAKAQNGKSSLAAIAKGAFPKGSVQSVPPQSWSREYSRAQLVGARLNIVADLPEADIFESGPVKAIISGDSIDARHPHRRPFTFEPRAAHLFAANSLPGTRDFTYGFWRRFIIISFNRRFDEQDPDREEGIAARILETELPGIVSWMVQGAQRALARGRYEPPASSLAAMDEWRTRADAVALYCEDCGVKASAQEADWIRASELHRLFREWCGESGFRPVSTRKFKDRMELLGYQQKSRSDANYWMVEVEHLASAGGRFRAVR